MVSLTPGIIAFASQSGEETKTCQWPAPSGDRDFRDQGALFSCLPLK